MAKTSKKGPENNPIYSDVSAVFQHFLEEAQRISHPDAAINHTPVVDMYSTQESIIIEVELSGVRKEDVEVSILGNTLTVKGLKYECYNENKMNFVCMERSFGRFYRTIDVPCPVDSTKVNAFFKNGLLTITLAKVAERRGTPKRIEVES